LRRAAGSGTFARGVEGSTMIVRWMTAALLLAVGACGTCADSPYSAAMMKPVQPGQCAYCDYPGVHEEAACPSR